jgi:hypothetical protein
MDKLLDMADKYDSIQDEPLPKLYVDESDVVDDEEDNTLIMVRPEKTYQGVGLLMVLAFFIIFWSAIERFVVFR